MVPARGLSSESSWQQAAYAMTEGCKQEMVAQKGERGDPAGWSLPENGARPLESAGGVVPMWKVLSPKF